MSADGDQATRKRRGVKTAGIALGIAGGLVGAGYAAQRAVLRGLRKRQDPDAGELDLEFDEEITLPSHDGGTIHVFVREARVPGRRLAPTELTPSSADLTIVFSHGVMIDSRIWVKQFQMLPELGVRVIAFDQRGHGHSICGDSGHSIENLGLDLATVLETLDLRDIVLVGHSMGGVAVQSFLAERPEVAHARTRGLVLLSSFAKTQLSGSQRLRETAERIAGGVDVASIMRRKDLGTMISRLGFGRDPQASHVDLVRRMLAECASDTARDSIACLVGMDLTAGLANIDLPTLIINGTSDLLTPPLEARRLERLIPGSRLVMLERAGHTIMLERPAELHELLLEFAQETGISTESSPQARRANSSA